VVSLGEIDVRAHFNNHIKSTADIQLLVDNFLNQLDIQLSGKCKVGVYSVIPPRKVDGVNTSSFSIPFLGTDQQRLQWTEELNNLLHVGCLARGFLFVDVWRDYALHVPASQEHYQDKDGFMDMSRSDGICHMVDPEPLRRFICGLQQKQEAGTL